MGTAALHQLRDALLPEGLEGGVHGEPPGAPREGGRPVQGLAWLPGTAQNQVLGGDAHRGAVSARVGAEGQAGVVRDIQPLVRVEGPRVGALDALDEMPKRRACGGPQAEGPVDVQPRPGLGGGVGDAVQVVEGAGVDLAGLGADDCGSVPGGALPGGQLLAQPPHIHPAGTVGRYDPHGSPPDTQKPEGAVDAHVPSGPHQDPDGWGSVQAQLLDVPAHRFQDVVSCRGQAGDVPHLASGHEGERRVLRQPEQLPEPGTGHLFDDGCGRAAHVRPGALVPDGREPVGRDGGREASADHEPEIAARR